MYENYPYMQSHTIAEIDLSAFEENVQRLKKKLGGSLLLAVVKTNAYGHGIVPISHAAVRAGADRLGVTSVNEGILLRQNGINLPIQLLGAITPEQAQAVVYYQLIAPINSENAAGTISKEAEKMNQRAKVHLKINTGLQRFGIEPENAISFCQKYYHLPGLEWEGAYTHFSDADEGDWETTEDQFQLFLDTVSNLKIHGFTFPILHAGASTIAIEREDMYLDMVRPGTALFGYPPAKRQKEKIDLKMVMTLKSKLIDLRQLSPNREVGYGGNYVTKTAEKIAVLPIGHGDGYKRGLSNRAEVLIKGMRAPIIGTISLDQTFINVTDIPDVKIGDEVILIGTQKNESITASELAAIIGSNTDEVLSSLMARIQRENK